jgi:hypothetical protein
MTIVPTDHPMHVGRLRRLLLPAACGLALIGALIAAARPPAISGFLAPVTARASRRGSPAQCILAVGMLESP